ncbi:MAG: hydroxyethylthiazole kinase [Brochothrix thermosphacta]|uniref:hydroxyethylthiazole kinase n=1 Tax=Brochothrix thermosphacta TaxID=2756 RepID=UPI0011476230|nr:hydroxyethylthiazole kinase [Brochothrix thermosphacta]MDO7864559.1 hydroxyethylthiazole kinase [Brochothrix thermosphacta]
MGIILRDIVVLKDYYSDQLEHLDLTKSGINLIMSDVPEILEKESSRDQAVILKMTEMTPEKLATMIKLGKEANRYKVPLLLEPIAVGESIEQFHSFQELIKYLSFDVIIADFTTILALSGRKSMGDGLEIIRENEQLLAEIANVYQSVIVVEAETVFISAGASLIESDAAQAKGFNLALMTAKYLADGEQEVSAIQHALSFIE